MALIPVRDRPPVIWTDLTPIRARGQQWLHQAIFSPFKHGSIRYGRTASWQLRQIVQSWLNRRIIQ